MHQSTETTNIGDDDNRSGPVRNSVSEPSQSSSSFLSFDDVVGRDDHGQDWDNDSSVPQALAHAGPSHIQQADSQETEESDNPDSTSYFIEQITVAATDTEDEDAQMVSPPCTPPPALHVPPQGPSSSNLGPSSSSLSPLHLSPPIPNVPRSQSPASSSLPKSVLQTTATTTTTRLEGPKQTAAPGLNDTSKHPPPKARRLRLPEICEITRNTTRHQRGSLSSSSIPQNVALPPSKDGEAQTVTTQADSHHLSDLARDQRSSLQ